MRDYELILSVQPLTLEVEDRICDRYEVVISSHGRSTDLTISASGSDVISAAEKMIAELEALGVRVTRVCEDLVSRKDIAERANVTTQAVGLWVRGERHSRDPFPERYTPAAGGLWLWSEVNDWLARQALPHDNDIFYPSWKDLTKINARLNNWRRAAAHVAVATGTGGDSGFAPPANSVWTRVAISRGNLVTAA